MSVKCYACNKPDTKYSCIKCDIVICNICSISAKENDKGYSEELYKVGFCTKCATRKIQIHRLLKNKRPYLVLSE